MGAEPDRVVFAGFELVGANEGLSVVRTDDGLWEVDGPGEEEIDVWFLDDGLWAIGPQWQVQRYDAGGRLVGEGLVFLDNPQPDRPLFTQPDAAGGLRVVDQQGVVVPSVRAEEVPGGQVRVTEDGREWLFDDEGFLVREEYPLIGATGGLRLVHDLDGDDGRGVVSLDGPRAEDFSARAWGGGFRVIGPQEEVRRYDADGQLVGEGLRLLAGPRVTTIFGDGPVFTETDTDGVGGLRVVDEAGVVVPGVRAEEVLGGQVRVTEDGRAWVFDSRGSLVRDEYQLAQGNHGLWAVHSVDDSWTIRGPGADGFRGWGLNGGGFRVIGPDGRSQRYDDEGKLAAVGLALTGEDRVREALVAELPPAGGVVRVFDQDGDPVPDVEAGLLRDGGVWLTYPNQMVVSFDKRGVLLREAFRLVGVNGGRTVVRDADGEEAQGPGANSLRVESLDDGGFRVIGPDGRSQRYDDEGNLAGEGLALTDRDGARESLFTESVPDGEVRAVDVDGCPMADTRVVVSPDGMVEVTNQNQALLVFNDEGLLVSEAFRLVGVNRGRTVVRDADGEEAQGPGADTLRVESLIDGDLRVIGPGAHSQRYDDEGRLAGVGLALTHRDSSREVLFTETIPTGEMRAVDRDGDLVLDVRVVLLHDGGVRVTDAAGAVSVYGSDGVQVLDHPALDSQ
jgi:hypothetical protein